MVGLLDRNDANSSAPEGGVGSGSPLRSVHTSSFAAILEQVQCSLLVSTYQAGNLILVRPDGDRVNTHFRPFNKPMGVALRDNCIAIGGATDICEYHNVPAAAHADEEDRTADACFLPRRSHTTGDIQIHEMEWGHKSLDGAASEEPELWFVNTRFSCLCTLSDAYSFVPRWRPPFISVYTPEDRCHLPFPEHHPSCFRRKCSTIIKQQLLWWTPFTEQLLQLHTPR